MADAEDIQPLVCDNGTGMVKVWIHPTLLILFWLGKGFSEKVCDRDIIVFVWYLCDHKVTATLLHQLHLTLSLENRDMTATMF